MRRMPRQGVCPGPWGGWRRMAVVLPLAALCSCGTTPGGYVPAMIGETGRPVPQGGLQVTICSDHNQVKLGDIVKFTAQVKNVGAAPVWIPQKPALIYAWTYPTGTRDNMLLMVPHTVAYTEATAQLLQPGQEVAQNAEIQTQYFPRSGITEFVALLQIPENTNAALAPFVGAGRYPSNGYGVEIVPR